MSDEEAGLSPNNANRVNSLSLDVTQSTPPNSLSSNSLSTSSPGSKRLIWRDIYAEVSPTKSWFPPWKKEEDNRRVVLDQVSGVAEPGQITFIMGSSGAGKTTLLNILTQRVRGIRVYGEVIVNKHVMADGEMRKMSAYVQQEDVFIGDLTVRETLMMAARLRMPADMDMNKRKKKVDTVAQEMGLLPCIDTKIGSAQQKSISRGEKKRVSFACESLTDPQILFCDEPTSGLDSFMALQVMRALANLAAEGKTIICSIHQPSSQVFELCDRLVLMAAGRVAYQGPADQVESFFKGCGFPCQRYISVPDHFMAVISKKQSESEEEVKTRVESILSTFASSGHANETRNITHEEHSSSRRRIKDAENTPEYTASWMIQFVWLFWRGLKVVIRNPMVLKIRFFQCMCISIIIGALYFQLSLNRETLLSFKGIGFNALRDMNMMFLFPCVYVFTAELPIVTKEYKSAMYHPSAYFMGKNLADSLQYLVLPVIYATIVYWMAGFSLQISQYLTFWFISTMMAMTATSVGYAAACLLGNVEIATSVLPLFTIPMMVFGGFYIDPRDIPWYFKPLAFFSWYRYGYEAHMINIFGGLGAIEGCEDQGPSNSTTLIESLLLLENSTMPADYNSTVVDELPFLKCDGATGSDVLKNNGYDADNFWFDMGAMMMFVVAWRLLALFAFRLRLRKS